MEQINNVIPLKPQYAIFNPGLRSQLEAVSKPETVTTLEQIICTYAIVWARRTAIAWANNLVKRFEQP
jgi:hypothetical protein